MIVTRRSVMCPGFIPYVAFSVPHMPGKATGPPRGDASSENCPSNCNHGLGDCPFAGAVHRRFCAALSALSPDWTMVLTGNVTGTGRRPFQFLLGSQFVERFRLVWITNFAPPWSLHSAPPPPDLAGFHSRPSWPSSSMPHDGRDYQRRCPGISCSMRF
jgi:hypothetical protein